MFRLCMTIPRANAVDTLICTSGRQLSLAYPPRMCALCTHAAGSHARQHLSQASQLSLHLSSLVLCRSSL